MFGLVTHYNKIGHEINESLENYGTTDREIYCRKLHKITEPKRKDCESCPYFNGLMQGHGHECVWEDGYYVGEEEKVIEHKDRNAEFLRASQLIDEGYLKR